MRFGARQCRRGRQRRAIRTFAPQWSATARVGYRFQETMTARARSSSAAWELAAGYRPSSRDAFEIAPVNRPTRVAGFEDARELVLRWIHAICRAWPPQRYGTAGLTATSPHYGVGVGGIFRFP